MRKLDHIMYASPDLDAGSIALAEALGVKPAFGGQHPGGGTRNALLSLADDAYLELIAPDPAQPLAGTLGQQILERGLPEVRTWAVGGDAAEIAQAAATLRLKSRTVSMSRATPTGGVLNWKIVFVGGHDFGDQFPFFIDWMGTTHPATTAPSGCTLEAFHITAPNPEGLSELLVGFNVVTPQLQSGSPKLSAVIRGANGRATVL